MSFLQQDSGPSGPAAVIKTGSLVSTAGAGPVCQCVSSSARFYNILLNGTAVTTAALLAQINVWDPTAGTWATNCAFQFYGTTLMVGPTISVTNGASYVIPLFGPFAGLQVAVNSWGSAGGTFIASIFAL